jgi:hypothetical protein
LALKATVVGGEVLRAANDLERRRKTYARNQLVIGPNMGVTMRSPV